MGFVEGQSLQQRIQTGPLPPREAAEMVKKIAEAIAYAHEQGVIHRDLKPANVLLDSQGEPKVTDFGLARKLEDDNGLTRTGAVMGTPGYMPPEQATGKSKEVGPQADVYALGAILYCLLTGRPPFQAASPLETLMQVIEQDPVPIRILNPNIPSDLESICSKCLSKNVHQRYADAPQFVAELDRFLRGEAVLASNSRWSDRVLRVLSRSRDDKQLREWSHVITLFSFIVLLSELVIQAVGAQGRISLFLAVRIVQALGFLGVIFGYRRLWLTSIHPAVSQMVSLWVVFFIACYLHVAIELEKTWFLGRLDSIDYFASYPSFSLFSGFLFAALGRQYWGGCYVISAMFLGFALLIPSLQAYSPLLFGVSWFAALTIISFRLRRMTDYEV